MLSLLDLATITAHLAVGALLLGSFVVLWALCPAESRSSDGPRSANRPAHAPTPSQPDAMTNPAFDLYESKRVHERGARRSRGARQASHHGARHHDHGGRPLARARPSRSRRGGPRDARARCSSSPGANALNMYIERDIDGRMDRTQGSAAARRAGSRPASRCGSASRSRSPRSPILAIGVNLTTALLAVLAHLSYVLAYTPLEAALAGRAPRRRRARRDAPACSAGPRPPAASDGAGSSSSGSCFSGRCRTFSPSASSARTTTRAPGSR